MKKIAIIFALMSLSSQVFAGEVDQCLNEAVRDAKNYFLKQIPMEETRAVLMSMERNDDHSLYIVIADHKSMTNGVPSVALPIFVKIKEGNTCDIESISIPN